MLRDAWRSIDRAFDCFVEAGDVAQAVAAAEHPLLFMSDVSQSTRMVRSALTLVPPDSHEAGRLLSRYGLLLNLETGDHEGAQEAFDRAMNIAEKEGDVALEMRTLANSADTDW